MRTRIRTKSYICGDYRHVYLYPVYGYGGKRRRKRYRPTSEQQAELNARRAEKRLEMLLETNFDEHDYFFTCTYEPHLRPGKDEEALRQAKNFIRRLQYRCKRQGLPEPVAVWCTELSKENKLYHHHFVIKCALPFDTLAQIWGKGRAQGGHLHFAADGMTGLSKYLPKEPIGTVRYHATRNLKKPQELQDDNTSQARFGKLFDAVHFGDPAEIERVFPAYFVNQNATFAADTLFGRYIYIKLYAKHSKFNK